MSKKKNGIRYDRFFEDDPRAFVPIKKETTENIFCKTGKGGGVNPTCSAKSKGGGEVQGEVKSTKQKVKEALKSMGNKVDRVAKIASLASSAIAMDVATTAVALHEIEYILHGNFPETARDSLVLMDLAQETIHVLKHAAHKIPIKKAREAFKKIPIQKLKDYANNLMDSIPYDMVNLMQSPMLNTLGGKQSPNCVVNSVIANENSKSEGQTQVLGIDSKLSDIARLLGNSLNPEMWSAYYIASLEKGLNHMEALSVATKLVGNR